MTFHLVDLAVSIAFVAWVVRRPHESQPPGASNVVPFPARPPIPPTDPA
jgi:hypothetical protein